MPYITQTNRAALDVPIKQVLDVLRQLESDDVTVNTTEQLSYVFTQLLTYCCSRMQYVDMLSAIGMLEMTKMEFYKTVCGPAESQKRFDNGEIEQLIIQ